MKHNNTVIVERVEYGWVTELKYVDIVKVQGSHNSTARENWTQPPWFNLIP